ncbi:MAG: flagellar motor switch protein FliG [Myxococcota bacterium]|nr:flagellar motor switch protein FliG [Myxococcota bacterium]
MNNLPASNLDGPQKAALVLLGMGEESAASVLKHMSARDVRRLHEAMSKLSRVPGKASVQTLRDFLEWLYNNHSMKLVGASDFIRRAAAKAVGEENVQEILGGRETESGFMLLEGVDHRVLANLLIKEHPQTSALVLAHLNNEKSAYVLETFPGEIRKEVLMRIARLDTISPETIREVASVIELELAEFALMERSGKLSGAKAVADIMTKLSNIDKVMSNQTLADIEELDEDLAADIRQSMFTFEDLERLDNRYIQALLREVDGESLVRALKTAPDGLRDKILGNMSARASQIILEDLESRGPMRVSEVTAAQSEIVRIALQMEQEGRIEFAAGGDDALV